jgi:hypothetical protein
MTSFSQWQANRRNARKSTGPNTEEGKQRSRCNAVRHGLTAETVIGTLEDAEDYRAFEAAISADYDAQSAVERELVLRLASALWRLRRATAIETGLFEIQAEHLSGFRESRKLQPVSREMVYTLFRPANPVGSGDEAASTPTANATKLLPRVDPQTAEPAADPGLHLAQCFLRLAPICRTTRSIGSAAMNARSGGKQPRSSSLSTISTGVSHTNESVLVSRRGTKDHTTQPMGIDGKRMNSGQQ